MSAKRAALISFAAFFGFIVVTIGLGSVGADNNALVSEDGYGISTRQP